MTAAKPAAAVVRKPRSRRPRKGTPGIPPPTADELAEQRKRQCRAVELALDGCSYQQIADTLGYADRSGAYRAVQASLDRHEQPKVTEYRQVENARYDRMERHLTRIFTGDDQERALRAADRLLRLWERRAKLNGLDAPSQMIAQVVEDIPDDPAERRAVLLSLVDRIQKSADGAGH